MREVKSFTIKTDILEEITNTKGEKSTSERVNELLRRGLEIERREFFSTKNSAAAAHERLAYQKAAHRTLSRD